VEICPQEIDMEAKDELQAYKNSILKVREALIRINKYKGNTAYKKQLDASTAELNRSHLFFRAKILKTGKDSLIEQFKTPDAIVSFLLEEGTNYQKKLQKIVELERFWPELEMEFEDLELKIRSFEIPDEIPMTEYRLDLEEAIKDFDSGCYVSALVLCRRSYEGALVQLYKLKTGADPVEVVRCKNCKNIIKEKSYMGIANLHRWAIEGHYITEKLKQVGFLLSDIGAGAAHPPLSEFPRDPEMARLGITVTIALLKELHSNSRTLGV
jgi:hypothetical protein